MPAFDTAGVNLTPLYFAKFTFSEMLSIGQTTPLPLTDTKSAGYSNHSVGIPF